MTNSLLDVREELGDCKRCGLCKARKNIVFGQGNPNASWMFIGEGPGQNEDEQGLPFVGRSGELLNEVLAETGWCREDVYITNVVSCRPPGNRNPSAEEVAACKPFLLKRIKSIRPVVITTLGKVAAQLLLETNASMGSMRRQEIEFMGATVVPSYHPSYILRSGRKNISLMKEDFSKAMSILLDKGKWPSNWE